MLNSIKYSPGEDLYPTDNDITNVPTPYLSDNPINQHDVYVAMQLLNIDSEETNFVKASRSSVSLQKLRSIYEQKSTGKALRLLQSRHLLESDPGSIMPQRSSVAPNVTFRVSVQDRNSLRCRQNSASKNQQAKRSRARGC